MIKRFIHTAFVILLVMRTVAVAGERYTFTDLGDLPGGSRTTIASRINAYGQVVGQSGADDGRLHAFLWTPNMPNGTSGSMVDLATLPGSPSPLPTEAIELNSYGQVIIRRLDGATFLWTPTVRNGTTGNVVVPAGLPAGAQLEEINSRGQIAGHTPLFSPREYAILWIPTTSNSTSGIAVDLGDLPGGEDASEASAINAVGQVVGSGFTASGIHAFLWTPTFPNGSTGTMTDLGDLPGGEDFSRATAINSHGQVLGFSGTADGNSTFLWTPTMSNGTIGSMIRTSSLGGVTDIFAAGAINSLGQLLGSSRGRLALWTPSQPNGTTGTLADVLSLVKPADILGWNISGGGGLNDRGQIVGTGSFDPDGPGGTPSVLRGFVLTPVPEPGTALLVMMGVALLLATSGPACRD